MAAQSVVSSDDRVLLPLLISGVAFGGVIFDLDGTLLDTESVLDSVIVETCESDFGVTVDDAALHSVRGLPDHGLNGWPSALLTKLGVDHELAPSLFSAVDARFAKRAGSTPMMPGASRVVTSLAARGVPLAIATSSTRAALTVKRVSHEKSIFSHFRAFICVEDVAPRAKPFPDAFLQAAAALKLECSVCVAVEDSVPGVTAALAAGCFVVAVPLPAHRELVRRLGAHLVLDSLDDWDVDALCVAVF